MTKISKAEADYKGQTVDAQHCSVCTMWREPRSCSLVKGDIAPGAWCKFFKRDAKLTAELGKAEAVTDFNFFMPIAKLDAASRTISGYASTPAKDSDGEVITLKAVKAALPGYMAWGNVREMHKLSAVGVAQEANIDDKGLFLTAKIVDDGAWKKCVEGVYKGFSIGGRKLDKNGNKVTAIEMTEISVVDRPANPECSFSLAKSAGSADGAAGYLLTLEPQGKRTPEQKALRKMAKAVGDLTKYGPPAAHDGFSLPARPDGVVSPNDSRPTENVTRKADDGPVPCDAHGKIGCKKCAIVKRMSAPCAKHNKIGCAECAFEKGGDRPGDGSLPYGAVKYADPGYQADGKKRYPIDTEAHIRAAWNYIHKKKNAAKYSPEHLAAVRAKIVKAWKKRIDAKGPPGAQAGATAKAQVAANFLGLDGANFLTLGKRMQSAGDLSHVFDVLRSAQRSLVAEGAREGGDKKDHALAGRLGNIAKDLAGVIGQKASHEGDEATTMTDADDEYIHNLLGADGMSNTLTQAAGGDPLGAAILDMVKRAAQPTRAERMKNAMECAKRARKAAKSAREAIEKAHKMHKDAFMAKAAKGSEGKEKDNGDFDHAGAMEKLQKAYQEIEKARTFGKAAMSQIKKASGRAGQRGQEAGDPEAGFYQVPRGVKDLTPAAMAGAKPGDSGSTGLPPVYPGDGSVYAGKAAGSLDLRKFAKNGMVPEDIVNLVMEKAQAEGELAALRRLPAAAVGGRRPYSFDTSKVFGDAGGGQDPNALNKALFDGVDVNAFGSGDERAHTQASARTIGNFLTNGSFGKSIVDPAFKGAAGSK